MGEKKINWRLLTPKLLFVPLAFVAIVSHHVYPDGGVIDITLATIGFVLLLVGSIGRIWVSAYISGRKNLEIVAEGPYSLVRHPLYFFSFLAFVGTGFACKSLIIVVVLTALFFATHWPTILAEEQWLRDEFGPQYDAFSQRVPRFFPRTIRVQYPETAQFLPSLYNRAVVDGALIMSLFMAIRIFEWGQQYGIVPIWYHIW